MNLPDLIAASQNARVHGNGFLQLDLADGERVHIFGHPSLPRQVRPTPIHDHRFGFVSTVLKGRLVNISYDLDFTSGTPTHDVYSPLARVGEDTELVSTGAVGELVPSRSEVILPGRSYAMSPGVLHETLTNELTVTHMRKVPTPPYTSAVRVLCPIGSQPDNEFVRYDFDQALLQRIIEDVLRP